MSLWCPNESLQHPSSIYERTHSSVVVVITADKKGDPIGQGSGFVAAKNRIVTNHHVIDGAAAIVIVFADGATAEVEGMVADSPARDLTILSVNTGTRSALKFGDELSVASENRLAKQLRTQRFFF